MLAKRTTVFSDSAMREMGRLATMHGAINLAQGFPDFPAPRMIKTAAVEAIEADYNQYAVSWGSASLRGAIAAKARRFNGMDVDPEREITVTCGATEAMMAAMLAVVDPGDEVIIFEPFYENYVPDAALSGATLVFVPLVEPGYRFDAESLRAAFSSRTRVIVVNTPHNPTGRVFTRDELSTIAELCCEFDVLAITDEIYEHIIYDGRTHVSLATLPGMAGRTITISGFSKTFSVTGWRVGYAIAAPELTEGIRRVHDFLTVGAPAPLQEAAAAALDAPPSFYDALRRDYELPRAILWDSLEQVGFRCTRPEGAYYIMANIRALSSDDDVTFARFLTEKIGVAPAPGSSFYASEELGRDCLRFAFCKTEATLNEAAHRLAALRS